MRQFSPSSASISPRDRALSTLRYIKKAAESVETYIESTEGDAVPTWVLERINQSATALGAALSFISYRTAPKGKK
jgi:hypothetical protein